MHYFALSLVLITWHTTECARACTSMHTYCMCVKARHYLPRGSLEVRRCSLQRSPTTHSEQDYGGRLQARKDKMNMDLKCIKARWCKLIFYSFDVVPEMLLISRTSSWQFFAWWRISLNSCFGTHTQTHVNRVISREHSNFINWTLKINVVHNWQTFPTMFLSVYDMIWLYCYQ